MRCKYLKSQPEAHQASIVCAYCNDLKGIIIRDSNGVWAHLTCVNWIPEIWFMDDNRDTIGGKLDPDRKKFPCYICRKKNYGVCIQCDYKDCQTAFHVRCAMEKKLIRDYESMNDQRPSD